MIVGVGNEVFHDISQYQLVDISRRKICVEPTCGIGVAGIIFQLFSLPIGVVFVVTCENDNARVMPEN